MPDSAMAVRPKVQIAALEAPASAAAAMGRASDTRSRTRTRAGPSAVGDRCADWSARRVATVAAATRTAMAAHPRRHWSIVRSMRRPATTMPAPVPALTTVWALSWRSGARLRSMSVTRPGVANPAPAPASTTLTARTTAVGEAATPAVPSVAVAPAHTTTRRGRAARREASTAARQKERKLPAWMSPETAEPIWKVSVNRGRKRP